MCATSPVNLRVYHFEQIHKGAPVYLVVGLTSHASDLFHFHILKHFCDCLTTVYAVQISVRFEPSAILLSQEYFLKWRAYEKPKTRNSHVFPVCHVSYIADFPQPVKQSCLSFVSSLFAI